jgi:hypothetical protein
LDFTLATIREEGLGCEDFLTFTFGFLSFIFGRSIGGGGSNSGSGLFTTVNTTNNPAMKNAATWNIRLITNPLGPPLLTLSFTNILHSALPDHHYPAALPHDQIIFPIETRESIFTQNRCLLEKPPVHLKRGEIYNLQARVSASI